MIAMDKVSTHLEDLTLEIEELINEEQESMKLVIVVCVFTARLVSPYALLRVFQCIWANKRVLNSKL